MVRSYITRAWMIEGAKVQGLRFRPHKLYSLQVSSMTFFYDTRLRFTVCTLKHLSFWADVDISPRSGDVGAFLKGLSLSRGYFPKS